MNEKDDIPGVLFGYVIRYLSTFVANEENRGIIKNKDEAQNARSSRGHQWCGVSQNFTSSFDFNVEPVEDCFALIANCGDRPAWGERVQCLQTSPNAQKTHKTKSHLVLKNKWSSKSGAQEGDLCWTVKESEKEEFHKNPKSNQAGGKYISILL